MAVEEAKEMVEQALHQVSRPVGSSQVTLTCGGTTLSTQTKPDGSYVLSGNIPQGRDCRLLLVDRENDVFANASVNLQPSTVTPTVKLVVAEPVEELTFGRSIAGRLDASGEMGLYRFQAGAGDMARVRVASRGDVNPQVELFDSQGTLLDSDFTFGTDVALDTRLVSGGTFTILVSDVEGIGTGEYGLALRRLNGPSGIIPLDFGQVVTGSIDALGEMAPYRFQAEAGDMARVRVASKGDVNPQVELFDSQGTLLDSDFTFGTDVALDTRLVSGGTFTILVSDVEGIRLGEYGLALRRLNGPSGIIPLDFGQVVTGSIDALGEMAPYRFQAEAGDMARVRVASRGDVNPQVELFDSQGTLLDSDFTFGTDVALDTRLVSGGTFSVLVSDVEGIGTGGYGLALRRLNGPSGIIPLDFDQTVTSTIDAASEMDTYSFQADVGDALSIRLSVLDRSSTSIDPQIELFDDQGNILDSDFDFGASATLITRLESGGAFTILVSDVEGIGIGGYSLVLRRLNDLSKFQSLTIGQAVTGALDEPGKLDIYTFTAQAGQVVFFDVQERSGLSLIEWQVVDQDGTVVFDTCLGCSEPGTQVLERGGTYTITVGESDGDETGTYRFQIWDVPPPDEFAITIGDVVEVGVPGTGAGNIETPGVKDVYTFTAQAGQVVFFDVQERSGLTFVEWQVVDQDGTVVFDTCLGCTEPGARVLERGGTYTITVGESDGDETGTYRFQIWDVPPPDEFAITIGDVVEVGVPGTGAGNVETPGVKDVYTFTAQAGQVVFFDVQERSGLTFVEWQVVDQDGTVVFDTCLGCSEPGTQVLERGGTYTITVGESDGDETGTYRFQIWDVPPPDEFAITIGDVVEVGVPGTGAGNIETPGVKDVYTFTAQAGQVVFFDVQERSGLTFVEWQVVDQDGTVVFDTCLGCTEPGARVLERGGTYTITVGESGDDETGTYRFQIWDGPEPMF